jgi:hypothetical protein
LLSSHFQVKTTHSLHVKPTHTAAVALAVFNNRQATGLGNDAMPNDAVIMMMGVPDSELVTTHTLSLSSCFVRVQVYSSRLTAPTMCSFHTCWCRRTLTRLLSTIPLGSICMTCDSRTTLRRILRSSVSANLLFRVTVPLLSWRFYDECEASLKLST